MAEKIDISKNQNSTIKSFVEIMSNSSTPLDQNSLDTFTAMLELDDTKFNAIYDTLMQGINQGFEDESVRQDLIAALRRTPITNIEEERKSAEDFINTIRETEELSENKKNFLISIVEKGILAVIDVIDNPREKIKVQIEKLDSNAKIPEYAHNTDAGADVFALTETTIQSGETTLVKTGLRLAIPKGYEIQVRPRSGLSLKTNLRIANAPGTIDADYRGELCILINNIGTEPYTINAGDKIAQLVIAPTPMMVFEETSISTETDRGEGGFGSTDA